VTSLVADATNNGDYFFPGVETPGSSHDAALGGRMVESDILLTTRLGFELKNPKLEARS
jgi:hypothetical protein